MTQETSPTIGKNGQRQWIYPHRMKGFWANRRRMLAMILMLVYMVCPFVTFHEAPFLRWDLEKQKIFVFCYPFSFHELNFLLFLVLALGFGVLLFTCLFGRTWCGWACPQTVWIEWLIRPIEEWIEGDHNRRKVNDQRPLTLNLGGRKVFKHGVFIFLSSIMSHVFLCYFLPYQTVLSWISHSPQEHWVTFLLISGLTGFIYFDLVWFREQFCIFLCPYARFQSVLLDSETPAVGFHSQRGEPRGRKGSGDCIDCQLCVRVCPTGIDIRNGVQMECIQCSRCIDACHMIMTNLKRPIGLIEKIPPKTWETGKPIYLKQRLLQPKVFFYGFACLLMIGILVYRLSTRDEVELIITRISKETSIQNGKRVNLFQVHAINHTAQAQALDLHLTEEKEISLICGGCQKLLEPFETRLLTLGFLVPETLPLTEIYIWGPSKKKVYRLSTVQ